MSVILLIERARSEAVRFIAAADAATQRLRDDETARYGCKETAACKRASMDLSRALSEMRRT